MQNLENADIAIQKSGRLTEGTLGWLNENAGTDFPVAAEPFDVLRELTDSSTGITVVGYSNCDIVKAVACGQTDISICGGDKYYESNAEDVFPMEWLGFGACKLVLARSKEAIDTPIQRLATSYPRIADAYKRREESELATAETIIDTYSGGIEMIGRRNNYDAVIDVVDTGQSMAVNGFYVTESLREFEALLLEVARTYNNGSSAEPEPLLTPGEFDAAQTIPMSTCDYWECIEGNFLAGGLAH